MHNLSAVVSIELGGSLSCAVMADSSVRCWGWNHWGQLGDGTRTDRNLPAEVVGLADVHTVSGGISQTCATLVGGTAYCWGSNLHGRLGDGTYNDRSLPGEVLGLRTATVISTGAFHTCAVLQDTTARCWGYNRDGALALGENNYGGQRPKPMPVRISGEPVACARDLPALALTDDGLLVCTPA